ncbi:MAG: hypothetical protein ACXWW1_07440, partial [Aeromicrobium sp.]
ALGAAFIAVRAARRLRQAPDVPGAAEPAPEDQVGIAEPGSTPVPGGGATGGIVLSEESGTSVVRIVEGRVIVPPTSRQVVDATMSKPLIRVSVLSHGLAHALRPESRDRIMALMRREFQSRRRQRKRAARQAARLEHPSPQRAIDRATATTEAWLGELPAPQHPAAPHNAGPRGKTVES